MGQLGLSLSKVSASFFSLRKLFDHSSTPVKEKLQLFRSYIAAKWTWCSPAVWPTVKALRSLESFKHTLLLSLLKLDSDPLIPFLSNTISRRRAVKAVCHAHGCKRWGSLWLEHLWSFWGHALRSTLALPLHELMRACSSFAAGRTRVPRHVIVDLIPRQLQLFWQRRRQTLPPYPWVEVLANDRIAWQNQLKLWLANWGYHESVTLPKMPPWYLHDRQLLLVGERLAMFRPARLFPDSPYLDSVRHIKPGVPSRRTWTCWVVLINKAAGVLLVPPKQIKRDPLWIQFSLEEDLTSN